MPVPSLYSNEEGRRAACPAPADGQRGLGQAAATPDGDLLPPTTWQSPSALAGHRDTRGTLLGRFRTGPPTVESIVESIVESSTDHVIESAGHGSP